MTNKCTVYLVTLKWFFIFLRPFLISWKFVGKIFCSFSLNTRLEDEVLEENLDVS